MSAKILYIAYFLGATLDSLYQDTLQRAALDGIIRQFFAVGVRRNHWEAPPEQLRLRHGIWYSSFEDTGTLELEFRFKNPDLGRLHLRVKNGELEDWMWNCCLTDMRILMRQGRGEPSRYTVKLIPPELFEQLWVVMCSSMRRYIWLQHLRPEGYARQLFPPP